ncbi:MAG: HDOD domain-containing protein [Nitrospinota bacterium]
MSEKRESIIKMLDKIPRFSATVTKVIQLSNDPGASTKEIVHAISLDPELTAKVLGLINSSYYGISSKIISLQHAAVMLGIGTIKNIAISTSVLSKLLFKDRFNRYSYSEFWEHNLACAAACKILAGKIGIPEKHREEYFIAGLLHDIGKVIFLKFYPEDYSCIEDPDCLPEKSRSDLEYEAFGIGHSELGSMMADRWKLPALLSQVIRQHHDPVFDGSDFDQIKAAVHISDIFCNKIGIGIQKRTDMDLLTDESWKIMKLPPDKPEALLGDLEDKVNEAKVFLAT